MFEPLFGDLFDLDGDGTATFEEEVFGLIMTDEMERAREKRSGLFDTDGFDDDFGEDFDPDIF